MEHLSIRRASIEKVSDVTCTTLQNLRIDQFQTDSETTGPTLDGLFIPTHRKQRITQGCLRDLAQISRHIYLMPSKYALAHTRSLADEIPAVSVLSEFSSRPWRKWYCSRSSFSNPTSQLTRRYDLPLKRTFALSYARKQGLRYIGLLDDDIHITARQIGTASLALMRGYHIAGFYVLNFPDVSTLSHLDRLITGTTSETTLGGNCLFLDVTHVSGFFPYVYNEDWFFILYNLQTARACSCGEVRQDKSMPWASLRRIRFEQFGETVIDPFVSRLQLQQDPFSCIDDNWDEHIASDREFVTKMLHHTSSDKYIRALLAADAYLAALDPKECVAFLRNLNYDMQGTDL